MKDRSIIVTEQDEFGEECASVIAVVIPSYKVTRSILEVIAAIGPEVRWVYVVDDKCPDSSGDFVEKNCSDQRVRIIRHAVNQGVGGAVLSGYRAALADGADIMVKIDGDGQMDPKILANFVNPILRREADYTKGNRFFDIDSLKSMPRRRLFGNAVLSLITKASSGYWDIFDPTNGYTAIHAEAVRHLPFEKLSKRYFFETDILFRLNLLRAVVIDIPMDSKYGDEVSHLKIWKVLGEFFYKNIRNAFKRIFYNYYLRDLSIASLNLIAGWLFLIFGVVFGLASWAAASSAGTPTSAGTVMLSALPSLMGFQLILSFMAYDIAAVPRRPRQLLSSLRRENVAG